MKTLSKRASILAVDDTPENLDVLVGLLGKSYQLKVARNGERALQIATSGAPPDLILLDIMMPGMDGHEVIERLKADPKTAKIPVIFLTAKATTEEEARGLELGAVDYITKPLSPPILERRVKTHIELYDQQRNLEALVRKRTEELHETRYKIIQRLGRAAEFKDNETGLHVMRMSHYSARIGEEIGMSPDEVELLLNAAPMHDIGKIGIPDRVLLKPGKLNAEEWNLMKKHPEYGASILGDQESLIFKWARTIALTHHEKWDGSGYPQGLSGEDIPLIGRITAIADVFDALTTKRPYKDAWEVQRAVDLLISERGKHFEPRLVDAFVSVLPDILKIRERFAEDGRSDIIR